MSMSQWNQQARDVLKGAKVSNDFFNTQAFTETHFPIKIPLEYAKLIDQTNPNDPLLKQVMPQAKINQSGFSQAPLNDEKNSPVAGLIHKYINRVLLITSQVCAIHCQYCFRQNFNYSQHDAISNWLEIKRYIQADKRINEVILSGGDPLSLSDEKLEKLIKNIAKIENVTFLNQSVLLKGVNDDIDSLKSLSLKLFSIGILPYYLHMLDKVSGAENYLVTDEKALQLHQQLQSQLSGYLVPRLVRDEDKPSKSWLL